MTSDKKFGLLRSMLVTVALGLKLSDLDGVLGVVNFRSTDWQGVLTTFAFVVSGFATLFNALEKIYGNRQLWITYNAAVTDFYALRDDLDYLLLTKKRDEISEEELDNLYARYSTILKSANESWAQVRQEQSSS